MKINKELFKGSATTLILQTLKRQDMYGYQLTQELKRVSNGAFELTEGTLYPLLHSLEKDKAVEAYWEEEGGRKRKYYRLTKSGKALLKQKAEEWESFRAAIELVLNQARKDGSTVEA